MVKETPPNAPPPRRGKVSIFEQQEEEEEEEELANNNNSGDDDDDEAAAAANQRRTNKTTSWNNNNNKKSNNNNNNNNKPRFYEDSYRNTSSNSNTSDHRANTTKKKNTTSVEDKIERGLHHTVSAYHVGHKKFTPERHNKSTKVDAQPAFIILPWSKQYKSWWGFLVFCALLTMLLETYEIAFMKAGLIVTASGMVLHILSAIFFLDIFVNFHLAFEEHDAIVHNRHAIAKRYWRGKFTLDVISVFPFYALALAIAGDIGRDTTTAQYLALLRLLTLARLHRVASTFADLQYNMGLSLMWLTLLRNCLVAFLWAHFFACAMYFVSRQYDFNADTTWIGGSIDGLSPHEKYILALYWYVNSFRRPWLVFG
jgi:Ion transport protein